MGGKGNPVEQEGAERLNEPRHGIEGKQNLEFFGNDRCRVEKGGCIHPQREEEVEEVLEVAGEDV